MDFRFTTVRVLGFGLYLTHFVTVFLGHDLVSRGQTFTIRSSAEPII